MRTPHFSHANLSESIDPLGFGGSGLSRLDRRRFLLGFASLTALSAAHAQLPADTKRVWNPKSFGAMADGLTLDTGALQQAIDHCHANGRGIVQVSRGTYLIGTIFLKSGVTLLLDKGATLLGSRSIADYRSVGSGGEKPEESGAGVSLIAARGANHVSIVGDGVIDGNGRSFFVPNEDHAAPPPEEEWSDVSAFYWKPKLRPEPMIDFVDCAGVHVSGIQLHHSSSWTLRFMACERVTVEGITIDNPQFYPNSDGIDIVCSSNVSITGCNISTGDDAICIKSEEIFGLMRPTSNISIVNCVVDTPCNGIKVGTGSQGAISGITVKHCKISQKHTLLRDRMIAAIAFEVVDGGSLRECVCEGIQVTGARTPIFIRLGDRGTHQPAQHKIGVLDGIQISDFHATGAISSSIIAGLPNHPVRNVRWNRVSIETVEAGPREWASRTVPEVPQRYPEANMFGRLPSSALFCRHADGIHISGLSITCGLPEFRPAIVCEDVKNLNIRTMRLNRAWGDEPIFQFTDTQGEVRQLSRVPGSQRDVRSLGTNNRVDTTHLHAASDASN